MGVCFSKSTPAIHVQKSSILQHLEPLSEKDKQFILDQRKLHTENSEILRQQKMLADAKAREIDQIQNRDKRLQYARIFAAHCVAIAKQQLALHESFSLVRVKFDYVKPLHELDFKCHLLGRYAQFNFGSYDECVQDPIVFEYWKTCIKDAGILVYSHGNDLVFVLREEDLPQFYKK